jgi:hypothetical protein
MKSHVTGKSFPRWIIWLGLLAWVVFIIVRNSRADTTSVELTAASLHNWGSLAKWTKLVLLHATKNLLWFLPVGFLAVFCLPPREAWLDRVVRRWIPAVAISFLLAVLVHTPFARAGLLGLLVPWTGCLLGTWAGMAWARGTLARLLFLPELALLVALFVGCGLAVLHRAVETVPTDIEMPKISSADRRHVYDLFAGKNPLKIREGSTVTLSITEHDLNLVLAWALSVENSARRALVKLHGGEGEILASIPFGGRSRYLNLAAGGTLGVREGTLSMQADHLRIGRVEMPKFILALLSPMVAHAVAEDPRMQPILARLHSAQLQAGVLTVSYGHGTPPKGFVSSLFHDPNAPDAAQIDTSTVRAQILNLIAAAPKLPRNSEARFGAAVRTAFRLAQDRSSQGTSPGRAAEENKAAVLALGVALGHPHVETLVGRFMDDPTRAALHHAFDGTTLRKRDDWPKHFFVSAALTVIAERNVSDATGLLKEEKDAAGGSGFSFGDLLADRAGTTFAQVATRDEASARALQARLAQGFKVDDFFPKAEDLPEGIQDADFQARYGGTGGAEFRRLSAEIERRIASCPAYASAP